MSNLYRGPSIDASYQVSVHLAMWFQRRRFLEIDQSETRIACCGHVCQWNWNEMSTLYRGPPIDASEASMESPLIKIADFVPNC
jgi:hypothetical protein